MPNQKPAPVEISLGMNRRRFIYNSTMAAAAVMAGSQALAAKVNYKSPNEKLNVACIGAGAKGVSDIGGCGHENIVALCEVDEDKLNAISRSYPGAKLHRDYRVMLEKQKDIDAVVVSTPDHHHAPAAIRAIHLGKHVYCQKPLTHTIWEARQLTEAARKYKVATQMGNQGHSSDNVRRLCEMVWSGAIGNVREVHCWSDRPGGWWSQGRPRPEGSDPVPKNLDWDLWLGPAPVRPYKHAWPDGKPIYHTMAWRGWWDFGCGALGDMGCHIIDAANWSLKLGAPISVEPVETSPPTKETPPAWSILRYQFPARGELPPVTLTWYDGSKLPARPPEMEGEKLADNGSLLVGDKGKLLSGPYGENPKILPESGMIDYKYPPQTIARIPDQNSHGEWITACKGGPAASSNFDVSGPFSETVLLGNLALRVGHKIEWDSKHMRVTNAPEAAQYIHKHYRKGWEV